MSDPERAPEPRADDASPSRESQLRAARLRAFLTLAGTLIAAVGIFYLIQSPPEMPTGACTTSSQCTGFGAECLHAPTGAYCTHSCNRSEDCEPGTHCDIPPWEKNTTRALCLHDTAKVGKN